MKKKTLNINIFHNTAINIARCYQCGKCSAGCPIADNMDFTSSVLLHIIQLEDENMDKQVLESEAIWMCLSCGICESRCPMEIDIPKIMDYLRHCSLKDNLQNKKAKRNIIPFHYSFLDSIKYTGRIYELGLNVRYKIKTFTFFQDLNIAFHMFIKGKLPLFPTTIKDKKQLSTIFKQIKE